MYLRVKPPSGDVEVSAPVRMAETRIVDFVRERRAWIDRQRERMVAARREVMTTMMAGASVSPGSSDAAMTATSAASRVGGGATPPKYANDDLFSASGLEPFDDVGSTRGGGVAGFPDNVGDRGDSGVLHDSGDPNGDGALLGIDASRDSSDSTTKTGDLSPILDRAQVWTDERRSRAADVINAALPGLLAKWTPIVGKAPTHVTLRLMTSRWGSCTPKTGRIRLNLQLGLMEPEFLEYVLVHELTHLWEHGHGERFRARMDAYLPRWRELRRELNRRVVL
nr:YgjP-like metallopeptidase domain-containing protein [Bifidobacterium santillanense]